MVKECKNRHYNKITCPHCANPKWKPMEAPWGSVMEICTECGFGTDERVFCAKCSVCKEKIKLNKNNMTRTKGSKNKVKLDKVDTLAVKEPKAKLVVKKTVEVEPEPVVASVEVPKELPVVDGYQVVRVFAEDHDGHTETHLLCEGVSEYGDRVRIHVSKDLL